MMTKQNVAANPRLMNILSDIFITSITIGSTVIRPSLSVINLGVTFDSAMTMSNQFGVENDSILYAETKSDITAI